jgi:hypothetical protein
MVRCRDGQKSSLRVGGTNLALIGFELRQIYFGTLLMQKLLISAAALYVSLGVAMPNQLRRLEISRFPSINKVRSVKSLPIKPLSR